MHTCESFMEGLFEACRSADPPPSQPGRRRTSARECCGVLPNSTRSLVWLSFSTLSALMRRAPRMPSSGCPSSDAGPCPGLTRRRNPFVEGAVDHGVLPQTQQVTSNRGHCGRGQVGRLVSRIAFHILRGDVVSWKLRRSHYCISCVLYSFSETHSNPTRPCLLQPNGLPERRPGHVDGGDASCASLCQEGAAVLMLWGSVCQYPANACMACLPTLGWFHLFPYTGCRGWRIEARHHVQSQVCPSTGLPEHTHTHTRHKHVLRSTFQVLIASHHPT